MRKRVMGWIMGVLVLAAASIHAQSDSDKALFDATIKRVDSGGIYLNYLNQTGMAKTVKSIVDTILSSQAVASEMDPEQVQLMTAAADLTIRLIGLENYKAQATSCITENGTPDAPPMYLYKCFLYTGSDPSGMLFDIYTRKNQPFTMLKDLPTNTRLAIGGHITPEAAWNKIMLEFGQETNPQLKNFPNTIMAAFEQRNQVKLPDLLKSIGGEYSILVTSSATPQGPMFLLRVIVNDKDGVLTALLKAKLPPSFQRLSENIITFPANPGFPQWIAPQFLLGDGKVTLVSHPAILEEIKLAQNAGLVQAPSSLLQGFPQEGLGYMYVDINQDLMNMLNVFTRGNEQMAQLLARIAPPRLYAVGTREEDGYLSRYRTNYSLMQLQTLPIAIWAGTMLPALNTAREKARRVSCMSNLKQIGLALKMYAMDHKDKFPEANNDAGLQVLIAEQYLTDSAIYKCPSTPPNSGMSYYYIGGYTEGKESPNLPLAFDKPGNHKGYVNVLFLDGHVERINIQNYDKPEDVINFLAQTRKYPPEITQDLLERCKKQ